MRYADWQDRFWASMNEAKQTPFKWGEHDCVLFAAKMADAISNSGYVSRAREAFTWTDVKEAIALTGGGLRPLVESVMGPAVRWTQLCAGDIVLILDDEGRESLAIHDGSQIVGPDAVGVKVIPFRCAQGGWKVD